MALESDRMLSLKQLELYWRQKRKEFGNDKEEKDEIL